MLHEGKMMSFKEKEVYLSLEKLSALILDFRKPLELIRKVTNPKAAYFI